MGSPKHLPLAARVAIIVVVVILVIILAVLLALRGGRRAVYGGNGEPGQEGAHSLGDAIHEVRKKQGAEAPPPRPPPASILQPKDRPVRPVVHGGKQEKKVPKPKKPWTEYKTWEELHKDEGAYQAYWKDVDDALQNLNLDWSDVRAELADKLYDNREWAGRINIVKGKPKIVELVPSPHAVGEGPLPKQAAAMVPAEVIEKLEKKPALFMFHTHPKETGGSAMPSATDVAGAMWIAYTGRFAADLVVSPYGVLMYTPNVDFRRAVWEDNSPAEAQLVLYRRIADMLAAMEGARSWSSPWILDTFGDMLRRYDVEYVVFPTDKYAWADRRAVYSTPQLVDHEHLHSYHERIAEMEKEIEGQKVEAAPAKAQGRVKRVRFAEPIAH